VNPTTGTPSPKPSISLGTLGRNFLHGVAGWIRQEPALEAPIGERPVEQVAPRPDEHRSNSAAFPSEALVGSIGNFARLMGRDSEVPEEFYFACGLTMVGAMAGTKLKLGLSFESEPRLYTVLLGGSYDVKKSTAMKHSITFFDSLKVPCPYVSYGVASAEGLVNDLNKSTGSLILAYDELRALVDKCNIKGSTLLPAVTSLFEQTKWHNTTKNPKNSVSCDNAHLSILGCCTSETYKHLWTSQAIGIGLTNRLFIVLAEAKPKVSWPEKPSDKELSLIRRRIEEQLSNLPRTFDITPKAKARWEKWYNGLQSSEHTRRLDTIGYRLLALIALTTDKDEIDLDTVATVCRILDYELAIRILTDPIDADGTIARLEESIRRNLGVKGPLTKNELRQCTSADKYGIWAFEQALKNLQGVGDIVPEGRGYRLVKGAKS
jgi:Protein of unknown function (DUF3987)